MRFRVLPCAIRTRLPRLMRCRPVRLIVRWLTFSQEWRSRFSTIAENINRDSLRPFAAVQIGDADTSIISRPLGGMVHYPVLFELLSFWR